MLQSVVDVKSIIQCAIALPMLSSSTKKTFIEVKEIINDKEFWDSAKQLLDITDSLKKAIKYIEGDDVKLDVAYDVIEECFVKTLQAIDISNLDEDEKDTLVEVIVFSILSQF